MQRRNLTKPQERLLKFILSGKPFYTQRELSEGAGFDHPQKAIAALMGLFMRGYLVVDPDYLRKLKE